MTTTAIPLHLAEHVLGLAVAAGLTLYALARREESGPGWLSLAVGGALLAASHGVAGALVAPDLAWPIYMRAAGYAAVAVGSAGRLVGGGTALVLVAPPGASIAAAIAGAAAAIASVRGVLGRRRDVVLLASGLALWAGADLAAGALPTAASALSLTGSATIGTWLLWRSRETLLSRIAASFLVALLVLVVGLAGLGGVVFGAEIAEDELDALAGAVSSRAEEVEREWTLETLQVAKLFSGARLVEVLEAGDEPAAATIARTIAELPGADVVVLLDGEGRVVASRDWAAVDRGALPEGEALLIAGDELVARARAGSDANGLVVVGHDVLAVGASPVIPTVGGQPRRDRQAGVLVVGRRLTAPTVVADLAATSGAEATVVVGGSAAASTLPPRLRDDVAAAVAGGVGRGLVRLGGTPSFLVAAPVGAEAIAALVLTEDAATIAGAERDFVRTMFLATVVGMVVAAALAGSSASRTTRPLRRLTAVAERVAAGDRDVSTGIDQPDEVGRLAAAFDHMTTSLGQRERELRDAAAVEAALRGRLEVLTASMGEGLVAVDQDGTVITVNPAAERLLGVGAPRAVGRPVDHVLRGVDGAGASLLDTLGGPDGDEVRAVRGTTGTGRDAVPVAATAAPMVATDGSRLGRVYVLRDISGELEVERMKTEFLSNISHELRTPLTPIKGYAEVMRRRTVPPERMVEFATNIAESVARLERIVGMLVDFAALEANRMRIVPQPTFLSDVVDEVLAAWRERLPERRFARRLARDLPPVHVDPRLLRRILEELIDNAVKFSDGPVTLLAEFDDGERAHVRLTVRDRGVGIAADQIAAITRDFHQLDGSATRQFGGLGLGLSLVRRIADRFGAEVFIDSAPGAGTEVHLLLPVTSAAVPVPS